ncbi:hypothetical protein DMB95_04965 [Campylobacter sp. MIT 12-8780]|uniref:hypothetical protein n=1 Tax=unclassified Campylobacter TaxID=2593542 RepID=UPI00115DDCD0|nr:MULTISPECIES: hypothetical protein [unclassified Campylobacter]NDJ27455.1 hypothetical protein [Campylobacter sp. MIT 19-121]TQR41215.1 hypothetical protein DMB95_04965 [Campylobacter sp. MIT 12-8780]
MKITNNIYSYPQKNDFSDKKNISDYEDFRNKMSADMEAKNYTKEQKLAVHSFFTASMVVANARENYGQNVSYWDTRKRQESFENAPKSLKIQMLEEQISIIKEPYAIQKGYYMGQTENEGRLQDRKKQAIDYLSGLLQDIKA